MDRSVQATCWVSRSPAETRALARGLAAALAAEGQVVSLIGALGAGKTEFAKGLAEGLGLDPALLASPTFTIANDVPLAAADGRPRRLVHADCFRLRSAEELELAGLDDWLGQGVVLLAEWGDRFASALGEERLDLHIRELADGAREISAHALGVVAEATLARWSARCR